MKRIPFIFICFSLITNLYSQTADTQDPAAKEILERVSAKTLGYTTILADFELAIDNRMEKQHSKSNGSIQIKGNKYYMESMGSTVYFDGKTMWTYMNDINEVTISEPIISEGDFVDNPALIFTFYNRDFKYRLLGEGTINKRIMYEIDLYPKDLNQPYSRFKLFVDKEKDELYMAKAVSKDGIDYTIYITNTHYNTVIPDSKFIFKPSDYPGIEIIDMR